MDFNWRKQRASFLVLPIDEAFKIQISHLVSKLMIQSQTPTSVCIQSPCVEQYIFPTGFNIFLDL
jgi:hypothetical protein